MTTEQSADFDKLNPYSYMFRLMVYRNDMTIYVQEFSNEQFAYNLCYKNSVVGSIAISENDIAITINKYFKVLNRKVKDANFSTFYTTDHFLFEDFAKYCQGIKDGCNKCDTDTESDEPAEDGTLIDTLKKENMQLRLELDTMKTNLMRLFLKI